MNSPLLALFVRSLSEDAHSKATYWTKGALCALTMLLLALMVKTMGWSGAPGLTFFSSIMALQMLAISLLGLSHFGSAITEEKEQDTLGLLRMTDLNPVSILLGKSTSRLLSALLILAAAFPFTILAVTLGGIALSQIVASYCTLGAYTFLLGNVSLLGSVLFRTTPGAARFSTVVIGLYQFIGPLLDDLRRYIGHPGIKQWLKINAEKLWAATPIARLGDILDKGVSSPLAGHQVLVSLVGGTGCFLLAWAAFDRFCDRTSGEAAAARGKMRVLGLRIPRPPRPKRNAIAWKEYYFQFGGNAGLILRLLGFLVVPLTIGLLFLHPGKIRNTMYRVEFWVWAAFYLDLGAMAARLYRSELHDQTLSSLAMLPSTVRRIAYRKAGMLLLLSAPATMLTMPFALLSSWGGGSGEGILPSGLQLATHLIETAFFVHLTIWLSLLMRRGALPAGIVISLIITGLLALTGQLLNYSYRGMTYAAFKAAIYMVAIIVLHIWSLRRLEALAAEG